MDERFLPQGAGGFAVVPPFLQETASALGAMPGVEAVAWCGSSAMGFSDAYSDFDFYVYTNAPVPAEHRLAVISQQARESQLNNTFWELEDEWVDQTGRRFNAMYRPCDEALDKVADRLDQYSADLGYTTAYCFSIANGLILHDPQDWLGAVQERLRQPFPEPLIQAIMAKNRPVLGGGVHSCYLAQIRAAIARNDLISLYHRTAVWIGSYTDILFAANRRYHPGEKRLQMYLKELPTLPENALEDVDALCTFAGSLSSPIVGHLSKMLSRLNRWLERNGAGTRDHTVP